MIAALFARFKAWILIAWAALVVVAGVFAYGRATGAAKEKLARERERLAAIKARRKKEDEIDALGPADVDARLDRWVRKPPDR
jgi:uncharacterized membrane protein YdfJ with MMPL/SSD domain